MFDGPQSSTMDRTLLAWLARSLWTSNGIVRHIFDSVRLRHLRAKQNGALQIIEVASQQMPAFKLSTLLVAKQCSAQASWKYLYSDLFRILCRSDIGRHGWLLSV